MKNIFLLCTILFALNCNAAPYFGQTMSFKQPDGTTVEVKLFGNEYYMRGEGLDGYTLVRDKNTHWICYATLSQDETELVSTGIVYHGKKDDLTPLKTNINLPLHLDISEKAREVAMAKNKKSLGTPSEKENTKTAWHPVSGNIKGLCIVVDFSDEPGTLPMSEFNNFCNDLSYSNYGNNGSVRKFYSDISGGKVDYQNVVYGYYRAPLTFQDYEQMPFGQGATEILGQALNWLDAQGFDFSTLSTNPDGSIMAINLMYTGVAQNWAQGMWWHMGSYTGFSADGVHSDSYNCSPANDPLELATVCHENGHMIGKWPDTYKYNTTTGPDGIGDFDLMCWYGSSINPVPPNPHFRSNAGWGRVVDVTNYNGLNTDTANSLTCYKYVNLNDTNEFFLIENRMQTGRSNFIEDQGLTIWHIDRMGDNQTLHHEVYLVHANNDINNHYDACFHQGFNNEYGITTTPESSFFNGDPSGLRVWDIGTVGNIMNYKLGAGQAAPSLHLNYLNISGDNNSNGFLEPGESGNLNLTASNFGQINSGTATITCTAIGTNSGYVTINTPTVNAGVINTSATTPFSHNISIASNTPLGTVISLRFLISDGAYSTYITRQFIIGNQITMSNQQVTTCSAIFYDNGGAFSNYTNITDLTTTFLAQNPTYPVKLTFSSFDLEDVANCIYDYVNIYDGPDISSPLIGTYCGTNSPGIVTSTHATGALTVEFHSDEAVTGTGWEAIVSCQGFSNVNDITNTNNIEVFPNPSHGLFNIQSDSEIISVSVMDIVGKEIYNNSSFAKSKDEINLSDYPAGLYLMKIEIGDRLITKKIEIRK